MLQKIIISLVVAAIVGWVFQIRLEGENEPGNPRRWFNRSSLLVAPMLVPYMLLAYLIVAVATQGKLLSGTTLTSYFVSLALRISIYFALLLCFLPLLRRIISPRACAALWLVPNFLYLTVYLGPPDTAPILVLTIPRPWLVGLGVVWAAGFVVAQIWQIVSHLRFRKFLLADAVPLEDPVILAQWKHEQDARLVLRNPIPILISPQTNTPLTIGFSLRKLRLVLPHTNYTEQEFKLIFRHEVRHIERQDSQTKAFLGFCCALCWFNPLMWIARRKAADDLELSCDELILTYSNEFERREYAELLLRTAGDGRGYTTCLSAAASSLRYRLSRVVNPRACLSGTIAVSLAVVLLLMSHNTVALADSPVTVGSLLPGSEQKLEHINLAADWNGSFGYRSFYSFDENALTEYLSTLNAQKAHTGDFPYPNGHKLSLDFRQRTWWGEIEHETNVQLQKDVLRIFSDGEFSTWLLPQEPDWDYLASLMDPTAKTLEIDEPPTLDIGVHSKNGSHYTAYHVTSRVISVEQNGISRTADPEPISAPRKIDISKRDAETIQLWFSLTPLNGYEVLAQPLDGSPPRTTSSIHLPTDTLAVPDTPTQYTVTASFQAKHGTVYHTQFCFICQ